MGLRPARIDPLPRFEGLAPWFLTDRIVPILMNSLTTVSNPSRRKFASDRLSEHFMQGRRDIFSELSGRELAFAVYHSATNWRTDVQDNRAKVKSYAPDLDRRPEYLGR